MQRLTALVSTAAVCLASALTVMTVGAAPAGADIISPGGGRYVALTPVRAVDTRVSGGALGQGQTRVVDLSRYVPSTTATAVVVNLTATAPTAAGYLTAFPDGASRPTASSLNKRRGETRSNSVTVALPANGSRKFDVFNDAGSTHVVVDVFGYYDPEALGNDFYSFYRPQRVWDERRTGLQLGDDAGPDLEVDPGTTDRVSALAINITVVDPSGPGYVTAWNGTGAEPFVSTANFGSDAVTPIAAVVPVTEEKDSDSVRFSLRTHVSPAYLVVDVVGYYATPHGYGGVYRPVTPTRIADTRVSGGGPLQENSITDFGVPDIANGTVATLAVNANVTAVDATQPTYLTVWGSAQDVDQPPNASALNPSGPDAVANAVQTGVISDDDHETGDPYLFHVYNDQGNVDLVVDLEGTFLADRNATNHPASS